MALLCVQQPLSSHVLPSAHCPDRVYYDAFAAEPMSALVSFKVRPHARGARPAVKASGLSKPPGMSIAADTASATDTFDIHDVRNIDLAVNLLHEERHLVRNLDVLRMIMDQTIFSALPVRQLHPTFEDRVAEGAPPIETQGSREERERAASVLPRSKSEAIFHQRRESAVLHMVQLPDITLRKLEFR
ncbi:hypothetical protein KC349_g207 [Hortaea werneckii]|nr:hypothetical protein KC349_g207 [Hortaea werneckii]